MWADFDAFVRERGAPGLAWTELGPDLIWESPWLNLYSYPAEGDYARDRPLGAAWHRLDSTVRAAVKDWQLPEHLRNGDGGLVYLSLGSLGSADVGLMQRLVDVMGATRHRVIVSNSGVSGGGPRRMRRSSKPWASRLPANDSSTMNTTRCPRS
ncbi:MAG: hypothetical protein A2V84_05660 [Chloroflexi bacterium RBG_16_70_13]|nr:MAG: hypothetical protein A2V84_05660 [Chloroflexi bacterium RBG_16_70_13]